MNWRNLNCGDAESSSRLGDVINRAISDWNDLRHLTLTADGAIREWDQVFVWADGEEPDCDTPRCEVDWTGFADAVSQVRRQVLAS